MSMVRHSITGIHNRRGPWLAYSVAWILHVATGIVVAYETGMLIGAIQSGASTRAPFIILAILLAVEPAAMIVVMWYAQAWAAPNTSWVQESMLVAQVETHPELRAENHPPSGEAPVRVLDDAPRTVWALDRGLELVSSLIAVLLATVLAQQWGIALLVVLVPTVVLTLAGARIQTRALPWVRADSQAAAAAARFYTEAIGAVVALRLAGRSSQVADRFARLCVERRAKRVRAELLGAVATTVVTAMPVLLVSGVALIAMTGRLTAASVTYFAGLAATLQGATNMVGRNLAEWQRDRTAFRNVARYVDDQPDRLTSDSPWHTSAHLEPDPQPSSMPRRRPLERYVVESASYHHPTGKGVEGVHLVITPGAFVVVCGPVGAGKSTFARLVSGRLTPQTGTLVWNGEVIYDPEHFLTPPHCAYVAQVPSLLSGTVAQNVLLQTNTRQQSGFDLDEAIWVVDLERDLEEHNESASSLRIGSRGVTLSGGQRQRLATARSFAQDTDILVVDDLSSALDARTEVLLWQRLLDSGRTIVAVSNKHAALTRASEVIVLDAGSVVAQGPWSQVRGAYESLMGVSDTDAA